MGASMLFQKVASHFFGRIERPLCPKCQTRMMLARLTPSRDGFELQYFNCPKCDHELTMEVPEVDPLKKAEGWLSGELGHSPSPCHGSARRPNWFLRRLTAHNGVVVSETVRS